MQVPPRSADTDEDAERVQVELLRAASVSRRLGIALSLSATVIGAARRALERNYPHLTDHERDMMFLELHYGAEVAEAVREHLASLRVEPRTS
jgi:hypothetical protein